MDERDPQSSPPETPPPELKPLDTWLHRDGERWRRRVPAPDALTQQARALATPASPPAGPPQRLNVTVANPDASGGQRHFVPRRRGRFATVLAAFAAVLIVALMLAVVRGVIGSGSGPGGAPTATVPPAATSVPFTVTSVALSVAPTSIAGTTCGSTASFTYTAIFYVPAHTAGGTIQFAYTLNNGRSQTPASVAVAPGETSKTFTFDSSGTLPSDHTYPGPAVVMVTSPNSVLSSPVQPSGACVAAGPFQVTSVSMKVNPTSIAGTACGTYLTVTYTATFHLAPNGPGGTIQFEYTVNNGRGSNLSSITVPPGQTTATYTFTWSGDLPADHTAPEGGGVAVRSPNNVTSGAVGPSGRCS